MLLERVPTSAMSATQVKLHISSQPPLLHLAALHTCTPDLVQPADLRISWTFITIMAHNSAPHLTTCHLPLAIAGFFSATAKSDSCQKCPAGQITINVDGQGATECSACAKGTWKPEDATDNKCRR